MTRKESEVSPLIQAWVGPHLPVEHVFIDPNKRPQGVLANAKLDAKKWLVHPVRRHLTHAYSELLSAQGTEIIGITGSAGKTTTKELVKSVLSQDFSTVWSKGNIDPIYNIPETVLHTPLGTEKLVMEMGIEFPGEMDFYLWLAQPKTGIVTTIYWTHTQLLGNVENVAKEKGRLVESLPKDGYAILNHDDPNVRELANRTKAKIVWYGTDDDKNLDIKGENIQISDDFKTNFDLKIGDEEIGVSLSILGQQFVNLALAAAAVGHINGISLKDIKKGLEKVKPMEYRMNPRRLENGTIVIDDSFNANPLAVKESIRLVSKLGKGRRKILVLGEMKELGKFEEKGHREVGTVAAESEMDTLLT